MEQEVLSTERGFREDLFFRPGRGKGLAFREKPSWMGCPGNETLVA